MDRNILIDAKVAGQSQDGFTLIELMIVIVILAMLAAIAIPSYRQYIIKNKESQVQAEMSKIAIDLNRWRASALTYKGFMPNIGLDDDDKIKYGFSDDDNKIIYLPKGSTASDYDYKLTLVDGNNTNQSLSPDSSNINTAIGRTWRMYAEPNSEKFISRANVILKTSNGLSCMNTSSERLTINSNDCGTGGKSW